MSDKGLHFGRWQVERERTVQSQMSSLFVTGMIFVPVVVFSDGAQTQEVLSAALRPAHARQFTAVFHPMAASAFDHARCNRVAVRQVSGIVHERQVAFKIIGRDKQLDACGFAGLGLFGQSAKFGNFNSFETPPNDFVLGQIPSQEPFYFSDLLGFWWNPFLRFGEYRTSPFFRAVCARLDGGIFFCDISGYNLLAYVENTPIGLQD